MSPQQGLYEWHLSLIHKVSGCPAATDGGGHVLGNRLPCSWLWQARPPVQSLHVAMSAPRILSVRLIGLNFAFVLHHLFLWIVTLGWLVLQYHPFVLLVWASSLSAVTHSSDRQGYTLNEPPPHHHRFHYPSYGRLPNDLPYKVRPATYSSITFLSCGSRSAQKMF